MDIKPIVNFLFEVGIHQKTPRSGFSFLGSGEQSIAEHMHRSAVIGYVLAKLDGTVDTGKIVIMSLFHDLAEGRTSDLNYVHQKYIERNELKAIKDLCVTLPFGAEIEKYWIEHDEKQTAEAVYVKDADNIEWILSLKEQVDIGNTRASDWISIALKRLRTDLARQLAEEILKTDSSEWWFGDRADEWWVSRQKKLNT